MEMKIVGVTLVAFVSLVVLAAVLMPILDDATTTEETFTNISESYARMTLIDDSMDYLFKWDHTKPTVATINGEEVSLFNGTLISSADTFLARYGSDPTGYYIQWIPSTGLATVSYSAGTGTADLTISISGNTATITRTPSGEGVGSETVNTTTISRGFAIDPSGDYVMKSATQTAYVNSDSTIYAMGLTTIGGAYNNGFYIDGTADSVTVTQYNPDPATYTISNVAINKTDINGFEDLYGFESVTFTATQIADSSVTANCTYNYVIVPAEVTAERSVHFTDNMNELLGVIPVMVIVAILIGVVALVIRSKLD